MNIPLKRAGFLVCAAASAICFGGCSYKEASWERKSKGTEPLQKITLPPPSPLSGKDKPPDTIRAKQ